MENMRPLYVVKDRSFHYDSRIYFPSDFSYFCPDVLAFSVAVCPDVENLSIASFLLDVVGYVFVLLQLSRVKDMDGSIHQEFN